MKGAAGTVCFYESTMWWFYGKDKFLWKVSWKHNIQKHIITSLLNGKIHKVPKNKLLLTIFLSHEPFSPL